MSYRLAAHETTEEGLRRIALEEIDTGVREAGDPGVDPLIAVHEARKRCKRLRGLLQLVRGALPIRREENVRYRNAARRLGRLRDAQAMYEAFEALAASPSGTDGAAGARRDAAAVARPVGRSLAARRDAVALGEREVRERLERFAADLEEARPAAASYQLVREGWAAIGHGFERMYGRGRRRMEAALAERTDHVLHRWRRDAKYHWYHVCLLQDAWPEAFERREPEVSRLQETLGQDHDLVVLGQALPDLDVPARARDVTRAWIEARREELLSEAFALGRDLYAEEPGVFAGRVEARWHEWHAPAVGSSGA